MGDRAGQGNEDIVKEKATPIKSTGRLKKEIPPSNWLEVYKKIQAYRQSNMAPVDTMGCERLGNTMGIACLLSRMNCMAGSVDSNYFTSPRILRGPANLSLADFGGANAFVANQGSGHGSCDREPRENSIRWINNRQCVGLLRERALTVH